jgi:hypothetical protein
MNGYPLNAPQNEHHIENVLFLHRAKLAHVLNKQLHASRR